MANPLVEAVERQLKSKNLVLPVYDEVADRLQKLIASGEYNMQTAADLIQRDPSLSAQVLKAANSLLFIRMGEVTTIKNAMIRLGSRHIYNIVVVVTQRRNFQAHNPIITKYLKRLWSHSVAVASGSKWLATRVGHTHSADEAFLGGLIHDFGMLFLLKVMSDTKPTAYDLEPPVIEEMLNVMHCPLGERLLAAWKMPELYMTIVRNHHQHAAMPTLPLLEIVTLTDMAATRIEPAIEKPFDGDLLSTPQAKALNVDKDLLAGLEKVILDSSALAHSL